MDSEEVTRAASSRLVLLNSEQAAVEGARVSCSAKKRKHGNLDNQAGCVPPVGRIHQHIYYTAGRPHVVYSSTVPPEDYTPSVLTECRPGCIRTVRSHPGGDTASPSMSLCTDHIYGLPHAFCRYTALQAPPCHIRQSWPPRRSGYSYILQLLFALHTVCFKKAESTHRKMQ